METMDRLDSIVEEFFETIQVDLPVFEKRASSSLRPLVFVKRPAEPDELLVPFEPTLLALLDRLRPGAGDLVASRMAQAKLDGHPLRARVYELIVQVCRACEEWYFASNHLMRQIVKMWGTADGLELVRRNHRTYVCAWTLASGQYRRTLDRCSAAMRWIACRIGIPHRVNRDFPLRYSMSAVYYLVEDRIQVLRQFQRSLRQVQTQVLNDFCTK